MTQAVSVRIEILESALYDLQGLTSTYDDTSKLLEDIQYYFSFNSGKYMNGLNEVLFDDLEKIYMYFIKLNKSYTIYSFRRF
jgi:hypothetical protein